MKSFPEAFIVKRNHCGRLRSSSLWWPLTSTSCLWCHCNWLYKNEIKDFFYQLHNLSINLWPSCSHLFPLWPTWWRCRSRHNKIMSRSLNTHTWRTWDDNVSSVYSSKKSDSRCSAVVYLHTCTESSWSWISSCTQTLTHSHTHSDPGSAHKLKILRRIYRTNDWSFKHK